MLILEGIKMKTVGSLSYLLKFLLEHMQSLCSQFHNTLLRNCMSTHYNIIQIH